MQTVTSLPVPGSGKTRRSFRSYSRLNDAEIVSLGQSGDTRAMQELITRFRRPIYALAYRLSGNYEDASDVAATVFLRLCQSIDTCKSVVTLPAWVNRIVTNTFYDLYRNAKKRQTTSLEAFVEDTTSAAYPFLASDEKSPLAHVSEMEQRAILRRVIDELPPFHGDLLSQFYLEEHSYETISQTMQIPMGTVKSRLNRARQVLAKKLVAHRTAFVA